MNEIEASGLFESTSYLGRVRRREKTVQRLLEKMGRAAMGEILSRLSATALKKMASNINSGAIEARGLRTSRREFNPGAGRKEAVL
jgi:hypothetical protein